MAQLVMQPFEGQAETTERHGFLPTPQRKRLQAILADQSSQGSAKLPQVSQRPTRKGAPRAESLVRQHLGKGLPATALTILWNRPELLLEIGLLAGRFLEELHGPQDVLLQELAQRRREPPLALVVRAQPPAPPLDQQHVADVLLEPFGRDAEAREQPRRRLPHPVPALVALEGKDAQHRPEVRDPLDRLRKLLPTRLLPSDLTVRILPQLREASEEILRRALGGRPVHQGTREAGGMQHIRELVHLPVAEEVDPRQHELVPARVPEGRRLLRARSRRNLMGPRLASQLVRGVVQEVPVAVSRELPPPPPSDTRKRATQIEPEGPIILFGDLSLARLVRVVCPREEHPLREPDPQDRSYPSQTDELREVETLGEPDLEL